MEFGIYDDGLLYDNVDKKLFYFYHDVNRFDELIMSEDSFHKFILVKLLQIWIKKNFVSLQVRKKIH